MADSSPEVDSFDYDEVPLWHSQNPDLLPDDHVFEDINDLELNDNESEVEISIAAVEDHDSPQPTIMSPIYQIIESPIPRESSKPSVHFEDDLPQLTEHMPILDSDDVGKVMAKMLLII